MSEDFYEATSVTKTMKDCLRALRKMYPKEKSYEGVLYSVLLEFQKLYDDGYIKEESKDWLKLRKKIFRIGFPDKIDWSECVVLYKESNRSLLKDDGDENVKKA